MADSVKIRITGDDSAFRRTLSDVGRSADRVFRGLMAANIVTKGISQLTGGLRIAAGTGARFEAVLSGVALATGATSAELDVLKKGALALADALAGIDVTTTASITMDGSGIDSSAMASAATGAVAQTIAAASRAAAGAQNVGRQFTAGLAAGIRGGRSAVIQAAIQVAQAALRATKLALQISSPSKLTEGFGRFFDEGLAVGIDKNTGEVVRSAVRLADHVAGAANLRPQLDMSGLTSSVNDAMSGFADAESRREYVFNVNGREMARATDRDYNTALNGYARRIGLGYGRG